jgi:HK97 family phage prohead protease
MNRAYATLDIRTISAEGDERVIEGIASTPTPDRMGDVVDPMGAKFALPMPLLWQHNHDEPIGQVEFAKPNKNGIPFKARIADPSKFTSEALKERLIEAWESIKSGLVRAVSIGFRPIEYSFMEGGGIHFREWEWLELSAVTIPAQADANITTIKQFDIGRPAGEESGTAAQDDGAAASLSAEQVDKAVPGKTVHVARLNKKAPAGAPFVIKRINHLA